MLRKCALVLPAVTLFLASLPLPLSAQPVFDGGADAFGQKGDNKEVAALKEKANTFKNQFLGLTSDTLERQCRKYEMARESGQQKLLEKQGIDESVAKMCEAIGKKSPYKLAQVARDQTSVTNTAFANNMAGKSVALGCSLLLQAKNNGKVEWFESQDWYQNAMRRCDSLSETSPMELEKRMQSQKGQALDTFGALHGKPPIDLLKESCNKVSALPLQHVVRERPWFQKAEHMCATIQNASPEELRQLLLRQQHRAETASGQLIKQTCQKFDDDRKMQKLATFENQPFYRTLMAMCSKLGRKNVSGSSLSGRCQWLSKVKNAGKENVFKVQAWYKHLESTCMWLQHQEAQLHPVTPGASGQPSDSVTV